MREPIDWQLCFAAWELMGKIPAILEQPDDYAPQLVCRRGWSIAWIQPAGTIG